MDAPPPPGPLPVPVTTPVQTTWPRSAQLVTSFLLGLATALLALNFLQASRWWARPSEMQARSLGYRIDLNDASHAELLQLPGVGESLARRIEAGRPFRRVEDLGGVHGVGPATVERLRGWVDVRARGGDAGSEPAAIKSTSAAKGKKETASAVPIDINQATAEELQRIPGVGPKRAQQILDERDRRPFRSVEELRRVPGIGAKTLEKLRPFVSVGPERGRVANANGL